LLSADANGEDELIEWDADVGWTEEHRRVLLQAARKLGNELMQVDQIRKKLGVGIC